ncbi:hypothetical protein HY546_02835, partial [archaeon]|nr:hypothetical protein [archaeon]
GLCKQYKIPLRLPLAMANTTTFVQNYSGEVLVRRSGVKTSNYVFGEVFNNDVKYVWPTNPEISPIVDSFRSKLHKLPSGLIELVAHIGFMDYELFNTSSLNWQRVKDLVALMDPSFKKALVTVDCNMVDWQGKPKKYREIDYEKAYYLR